MAIEHLGAMMLCLSLSEPRPAPTVPQSPGAGCVLPKDRGITADGAPDGFCRWQCAPNASAIRGLSDDIGSRPTAKTAVRYDRFPAVMTFGTMPGSYGSVCGKSVGKNVQYAQDT